MLCKERERERERERDVNDKGINSFLCKQIPKNSVLGLTRCINRGIY